VYKFDPAGAKTIFAGTGESGYSGDNGPAAQAKLEHPSDVFAAANGSVYIADNRNHRIRRVDTNNVITTIAGAGDPAYAGDGHQSFSSRLNDPRGTFADMTGNIFIADTANHRVRKIDPSGIITTVAGNGLPGFSGDNEPATAASLHYPTSVFADAAGALYIADSFNDRIRKVDSSGIITTIAGSEETGYTGDGGAATLGRAELPTGGEGRFGHLYR
jgi:sugar lactone lactonase YvrE